MPQPPGKIGAYHFRGFFVGADIVQSGVFSAGAAFAGLALTSNRPQIDNVFSFMTTVHGRLFNTGPFSRIGVNLALYQNPEMGFFLVANGPFSHVVTSGRRVSATAHNRDLLALEGMVDFILPVPFGTVGFAYGVLLNLEDNSDAFAMQTALQATIPFWNGFSAIPGARFRFDNDYAGRERMSTVVGIHFRFNW